MIARPAFRTPLRASAMPAPALALGFALAGLLGAAAPASAQVIRTFTTRFTATDNATTTLFGNTLMTCQAGGQCAGAQAGGNGNVSNQNFTMTYVDVDTDATTFCSSRATLGLPAGATVLWAGLYFGGWSTNAARNTVKFATPTTGYVTLTATQLDASGSAYQGFVDVTTAVRNAGNGTYAVANVQSTNNTIDVWGGWSIVVAYRLDALAERNVTVADGFVFAGPGNDVNFTVSGFLTPLTGTVQTNVGFISYDGDLGHQGEDFILNATTLGDAQNPTNNVFNSTISLLGSLFTAKTPDYVNQLGFDADILAANGVLGNGTSSANIQLKASSDRYYAGMITFATDVYVPVFEGNGFQKTVVDLNGAPARPGDVLEYTLSMKNLGLDTSVQTELRDTLPSTLDYVPGSLSVVSGPNVGAKSDAAGDDQAEYVAASRSVVMRLGTGANGTSGGSVAPGVQTVVRFRASVHVPAPNASVVSNQAGLAFVGQQLGIAYATRSDGDTLTIGTQATTTTVSAPRISGRVFEDASYGGGAGRTFAVAGGSARPGARVELYDGAGAFTVATTTDASGNYVFDGYAAGNYTVRVASATVTSGRPGSVAGLLPVQTFRTVASTGTAVADAARVGGEDPTKADAGSNTTSQTLAALTTASATPQSVAPAALATADIGGVDFGYNFDTVVNVNDAGAGSLRQFLSNANVLQNAGLAQSGLTAGVENAIFMIPDGLAHPGLRAGLTNQLTSGVARIVVLSTLPAFNAGSTRVDGALQTANVGNTNPGVLGAGGTAGVDGLAVATVAGPEVEVVDGANLAIGFDVQAGSTALAAIAISGFGNAADSDANADVRVGSAAAGSTIAGCVIGTSARTFTDPGAAARSGGDHVRGLSVSGVSVSNSLVGFGAGNGIALVNASSWTIIGNELRDNGQVSAVSDGLVIATGGAATVRGNLVAGNGGCGVDLRSSAGSNTLENNTVSGNGVAANVGAETPGIRLGGASNVIDRNVVNGNYGAGVIGVPTLSTNRITRNSIYANGTVANRAGTPPTNQIGIDLLASGQSEAQGTPPFVTKNDSGDGDAGANGLLNFPVLSALVVGGGTMTITGWARPGATIELFVADRDPSGFGEGRTYLTTLVEGSALDLDATTGPYSPPVNGLDQGSDNTSRFRFTVATPATMPASGWVTATATLANATSEFSGCVAIASTPAILGYAYDDRDHDSARDAATEPGTGAALWVKLVPVSAPAAAILAASVDPTSGAYVLANLVPATYDVVLDDNATLTDVTPTLPAGWLATEAAPGRRFAITIVASDRPNENFGLWHGSTVSGRVFRDDGAAGAPGNVANDGIQQAGEPGVSGVDLVLVASFCVGSGGGCDSTTTDGAGDFRLWLPFGASGSSAEVRERNPVGWVSTGGAAGTTGGAYARAADRVAWSANPGVVYTGVRFADVPPSAFAAAGAASVAPGAAATYAHRFTAGSGGSVSFSAAQLPSPAIAGWSVVVYRDADCDGVLDPGETPVAPSYALASGQSVCVLVRHASPAGAPAGASEQATVTAAFTYVNAAPALSANALLADVTTVLAAGGGLAIVKSVDRAAAVPGDVLTYTITYTNLAPTPLTSISIQDATPSYTVFVGGSCGTLGAGLSSCALTTAPAVDAAGALAWTLTGPLAPGATGSVSFQVRVR
jgi:uncharacterized repeat protein (TIGR01451 family)